MDKSLSSLNLTMKRLTVLLLLHQTLAQYFNIDDCVIDYRSLENMWDRKLVDDIELCNDKFKPPPQNGSDPLRVKIAFVLKSFRFYSAQQEFVMYTRTLLKWQDDRLKWDPNRYDRLDKIPLTSGDVWVPGFRLINNIADVFDESEWNTPCEVKSSGQVQCVGSIVYQTKCATDLRDWPFDAQNCKMEFGPIPDQGVKLLLDTNERAIFMVGTEYGTEWDIMGYDQELDHNSDKQLIMKFRLERHADILAAIVVYPVFILTALTLSGLLIDARRKLRLLFLCFSMICHFDCLCRVVSEIPHHNKKSPSLLLYYRGSFLMTAILLGVSLALKFVCTNEIACHSWMTSVNDFVYSTFVKFFIWPRWEIKVEESEGTNTVKSWTDFANIVNSILLVISIIVYAVMYCVFIPLLIPIDFLIKS